MKGYTASTGKVHTKKGFIIPHDIYGDISGYKNIKRTVFDKNWTIFDDLDSSKYRQTFQLTLYVLS